MHELDSFTLMMAVQAVSEKIKRYEQLLSTDGVSDKQEVILLIDSYKRAAEKLQNTYLHTRKQDKNFHKYVC